MSPNDLLMLQQMFAGSMVKVLDARNTGMRIKSIDYNAGHDSLYLIVNYFELKVDSVYTADDDLNIPFDRFVNEFAYWENQHEDENIENAKWMPLRYIVQL